MRAETVFGLAVLALLVGAAVTFAQPGSSGSLTLTALQRADGSVLVDATVTPYGVVMPGTVLPTPHQPGRGRPRVVLGRSVPDDIVVCRELDLSYECKPLGALLPAGDD